MNWLFYGLLTLLTTPGFTWHLADPHPVITVTVHKASPSGQGQAIGTIRFEDSAYGLLIQPNLTGLSPGTHGMHIHSKPSCAQFAKAAGKHLDPFHSQQHLGPFNHLGHLGDLPLLIVDKTGKAFHPLLAPKLSLNDIHQHSIVIHAGSDNYQDQPQPLGGGGKRIACAVIP
jgi:Cu-Zn family superoxide dismutase